MHRLEIRELERNDILYFEHTNIEGVKTIHFEKNGLDAEIEAQDILSSFDLVIALKNDLYEKAYEKAKELLGTGIAWYSPVESAQFPHLQAEIIAYNSDNSKIGVFMQRVIDRGRHTAQSLSDLITPKIEAENIILQSRDNHIKAIETSTLEQLLDYDINLSWN